MRESGWAVRGRGWLGCWVAVMVAAGNRHTVVLSEAGHVSKLNGLP